MKKKLLISWGSPYQFYGSVVPLIPKLSENFLVYVIFVDYRTPQALREWLETMRAQKLIEQYWLLSDFDSSFHFSDLWQHHWYVRQHVKTWSDCDFDVLLACDDLSSYQRYLSECVITNKCLHLCWISGRTHLLIEKNLTEDLLNHVSVSKAMDRRNRWMQKKNSRLQNLVARVKKERSLSIILKKGIRCLLRAIEKNKRKCIVFLDRIFLPGILVRKIFPYAPYDYLTQTGPGECDAMIFCDEVVAKAHAPLCKAPAIYLSSYPTEDRCRCLSAERDKSAILVGVGHGHEIGDNFLSLYYRDLKTVLEQTGGKTIHLRPHPRATGNNLSRLNQYLNDRGMDTTIVGNEKPVWEIACDYLAVAGPLSESLRDARAACDFVSVACLTAVSDPRYADPRFSFGDSHMIGWIEKDGSYGPDIFIRRKYQRPQRKAVDAIILELVDRGFKKPL